MGSPFVFGDIVRIAANEVCEERGIVGGVGMVVGANVTTSSGAILGEGSIEDTVLVSLDAPLGGTILIASRLLESTGEAAEWDVIDGLADARAGREETVSAAYVRVRPTPETEKLGLAGLVGEVMGETIPSSSGVEGIVGGDDGDYAVNAWFEERREQFWFHPDLLEPTEAG